MKKYFFTLGLFIILVSFTGCYTVIWSPEMDFPTTETYEQEYYNDGYYADPYFGDYGYYYQYPWWLSITPPSYSTTEKKNRDDNSTMERIRNRDGSRTTPSREPIINNTPVTTSGSSGSSGSTGSSSSPGKSTDVKDSGNSNNGSTNSNTGTTTRSSSSDSSKERNNDGGRNNGGRK